MVVGDMAPVAAIARRKPSHRGAPLIVPNPVARQCSSELGLGLFLVDNVHGLLVLYVRWHTGATALARAQVRSDGAILARRRWALATSARMCAKEGRSAHLMSLFSNPLPTYALRRDVRLPSVLTRQQVPLRPPP